MIRATSLEVDLPHEVNDGIDPGLPDGNTLI